MDMRDFDIRPLEEKARDFRAECQHDDDDSPCSCGAEMEIIPWNDGMLDIVVRSHLPSWRERLVIAWYAIRRGKTIDAVTLPPIENARLFAWIAKNQPHDANPVTTTATHMVFDGDRTYTINKPATNQGTLLNGEGNQ